MQQQISLRNPARSPALSSLVDAVAREFRRAPASFPEINEAEFQRARPDTAPERGRKPWRLEAGGWRLEG